MSQFSSSQSSPTILEDVDLLVIGGGINGAGIANDAAGRGVTVALYESNDFASATSSASSKLLHGGLRYLELFEFKLVAEALKERGILLKKAPHLVTPLRFILPHTPELRPAWLIRTGLFIYDRLCKSNRLPNSTVIDLEALNVLMDPFKKGFEYSDCWVDDARLVMVNLIQASNFNAQINNYCKVVSAKALDGGWLVTVFDKYKQQYFQQKTKVLVNAAGPWVEKVITNLTSIHSSRVYDMKKDPSVAAYTLRLIKGSHIVLPKQYMQPQAFILQNDDRRIVFVIPYLDKYTMVGTTDLDYKGDLEKVQIAACEIEYLLDVINRHFKKKVVSDDVIWSFSGVRPLATKQDDAAITAQSVSRDYIIDYHESSFGAPLLNVYGGKITTYRKLADSVMQTLSPLFPNMKPSWTESTVLPGGDFKVERECLTQKLISDYPFIKGQLASRYIRLYGTLCWQWLGEINQLSSMGEEIVPGVYRREIDYLVRCEFAQKMEDILWRRSKLGLYLNAQQQAVLEADFNENYSL